MTATDGLCTTKSSWLSWLNNDDSVAWLRENYWFNRMYLRVHHRRVGIISDLHLDYNTWITPRKILEMCFRNDIEILIVCGDVHYDLDSVCDFLNKVGHCVRIIYIIGNHELFLQRDYKECVEYIKRRVYFRVNVLASQCCYITWSGYWPIISNSPSKDDFCVRIYGSLGWDGNEDYVQRGSLDTSTIPYKEYEKLEVCGIPTICVTHYPIEFEHPDIICYIHGHDHKNSTYTYNGKPVIGQYQVGRNNNELGLFMLEDILRDRIDIDSRESPCKLTWNEYVQWYRFNGNTASDVGLGRVVGMKYGVYMRRVVMRSLCKVKAVKESGCYFVVVLPKR